MDVGLGIVWKEGRDMLSRFMVKAALEADLRASRNQLKVWELVVSF